ncbi:hypothetical protein PENANT_c333G04880, partial [Penicillium antarcticum]
MRRHASDEVQTDPFRWSGWHWHGLQKPVWLMPPSQVPLTGYAFLDVRTDEAFHIVLVETLADGFL